MPDTAAIIAAAARLLRAWEAAIQRVDAVPFISLLAGEVHDAAQELMRATETNDLLAAYAVLDDLVAEIRLYEATQP